MKGFNHKRRFKLILDLGADTIGELAAVLHSIATEIDRMSQEEGRNITSGGYASGYTMKIEFNPEMTGEKYRNLLKEYLTGLKK